MSYERFNLSREELLQYKQRFIKAYIEPFDIHIRQLVDIRNKLFHQVKIIDNILNTSIDRNNFTIDTYELFDDPEDKWQKIFDYIIRKIYHNIVDFNDLDGYYLYRIESDFDKKILRDIHNV